jgi:hypothetical protein
MANHNPTPNHLAHVPEPAGAVNVDEWTVDRSGAPTRWFWGRRRSVDVNVDNPVTVGVGIVGEQHADGASVRWIVVTADELLDLPAARQLARALIAAADEADQHNTADYYSPFQP